MIHPLAIFLSVLIHLVVAIQLSSHSSNNTNTNTNTITNHKFVTFLHSHSHSYSHSRTTAKQLSKTQPALTHKKQDLKNITENKKKESTPTATLDGNNSITINPNYPKLSRILKEEGENRIEVTLNSNNELIQTVVIKSSGFKRLDDAAIDAIKNAFKKNHKTDPTPSNKLIFYFRFKLEGFELANSPK